MSTTTTAAHHRPSRRSARIATLLAVPAAVAVSGLVVSQASYSAYSATTTNPTSNWTTGTVALTDDDGGTTTNSAAFTATNLKPGATGTRCIVVTSSGSLGSTVKLYGTGATTTKDLASNINLTITRGSGGSFGDCTGYVQASSVYSGTLAGFGASHTGYPNGLAGWTPTGTAAESRTYQLAYTVSSTAPDSTQGGTAAIGFTWEAQNS